MVLYSIVHLKCYANYEHFASFCCGSWGSHTITPVPVQRPWKYSYLSCMHLLNLIIGPQKNKGIAVHIFHRICFNTYNKMFAILLRTLSRSFSCMNIVPLLFKLFLNMIPKVKPCASIGSDNGFVYWHVHAPLSVNELSIIGFATDQFLWFRTQ